MSTNSGTLVLHICSTSRLRYSYDREAQVNEAVQQLGREEKRVVNILDGPITPFGPFGNVYSDVTIIWEKDKESLKNNIPAANLEKPAINIENTNPSLKASIVVTSDNYASIISRIDLFLEDEEWEKAKSYCDAALDYNSTSAEVYLRLVLAEGRLHNIDELTNASIDLEGNRNFRKALRFAVEPLKTILDEYWKGYVDNKTRLENKRFELNDRISRLNGESNDRVTALKNELTMVPGQKEIGELSEQISKLMTQKDSLGIFKVKERKSLQKQIDQVTAERESVKKRIEAARSVIEGKIATEKEETRKRIADLKKRVDTITNELTREQPDGVNEVQNFKNEGIIDDHSNPQAPENIYECEGFTKKEAMYAPFPSVILSVKVNPGTRVKRGEVLLTCRAMDMDNNLMAMHDGIVVSVEVTNGMSVQSGDLLIQLMY